MREQARRADESWGLLLSVRTEDPTKQRGIFPALPGTPEPGDEIELRYEPEDFLPEDLIGMYFLG